MEEEKKEEVKAEVKTEEPTLLDKAEQAALRMKEENDRFEQLLIRQEKAKVKETFQGTSQGRVEPEPPKQLTAIEYAKALDRGEVNPLKDDGLIH